MLLKLLDKIVRLFSYFANCIDGFVDFGKLISDLEKEIKLLLEFIQCCSNAQIMEGCLCRRTRQRLFLGGFLIDNGTLLLDEFQESMEQTPYGMQRQTHGDHNDR